MAEKRMGVGIVGTGRRGYALGAIIARMHNELQLEIRALCNRTPIRMEKARNGIQAIYQEKGVSPNIALYENYADLVRDPQIGLVMVTTSSYAHREPTVLALRAGKKVYLDKPLAHNLEDSLAIYREQLRTNNAVIMSFTRRFEKPWITTWNMVRQGVIGDLKMILVRDVIPYHTLFQTYSRKIEWSGGVLAEKMSHIFDVFNWFARDEPKKVTAFGGQAVFVPNPNAPECCSKCSRDCPYRVGGLEEKVRPDAMVDFDSSRSEESDIIKRHDTCVWFPGADTGDHGLISVEYARGIKASLFWAVFGPDTDDQETMELVGEKGRIILIRQIGRIDVVANYGKRHEVLDARGENFASSHFGADDEFIRELDRFCQGATPSVTAKEGLLASRLVEAAHRSIWAGGQLVPMDEVENA